MSSNFDKTRWVSWDEAHTTNDAEVAALARGYQIPHGFVPVPSDPHYCAVCGFANRPNDRPGYHEVAG